MNSYAVMFLAMAQIAATLVGFVGVVFILGERSSGKFDTHESSALFHFIFAGISAVFISLLGAFLLIALSANEQLAWRCANTLSGIVHLCGAGKLALEHWRQSTGVRVAPIVSAVGIVAGVVCLLAAAGYFKGLGPAVFTLATMWAIMVSVITFVSLLSQARNK